MKIQTNKIKAPDADRLAVSLLSVTARMFEDPKIQAEFKAWQAARKKEAVLNGAH